MSRAASGLLSLPSARGLWYCAQIPGFSLEALISGALKGAGVPSGASLVEVPPQSDYAWEPLPAAARAKGAGSAAAAAADMIPTGEEAKKEIWSGEYRL